MNQIQFETSKVFGVFVKINDFKEMKRAGMNLTGNFRIQYKTTKGTVSTFTVDGIDENYKLQGFVSELTDEQKSMICEETDNPYWYGQGMKWIDYKDDSNCFILVSESFASLLTSLNVLLVNPLQDEPPHNYGLLHMYPTGDKLMDLSFKDAIDWQTAQQHVGNWILLTANK